MYTSSQQKDNCEDVVSESESEKVHHNQTSLFESLFLFTRSMTSNFFFKKGFLVSYSTKTTIICTYKKQNKKTASAIFDKYSCFPKGKGNNSPVTVNKIAMDVTWIYENVWILCSCGQIIPYSYIHRICCWVITGGLGCSYNLSHVAVSHWVVKHHVLFGELQQHRVVEELADTHILTQTLQNNKYKSVIQRNVIYKIPRDKQVDKRLTLRLRVLIMNSLARWGAGWGSRGLITILLSRGSPGTIWEEI